MFTRLPRQVMKVTVSFFVDLPTVGEREEIIKLMQKKFARTHITLDTKILAEATEGFSGAELESLFTGALYEAFYAKTDLNTTLLVDQASRLVPLSSTMSAEIDALRGWSSGRTIPATPRVSEHVSEAVGTGAQLRRVKKVTTLEN